MRRNSDITPISHRNPDDPNDHSITRSNYAVLRFYPPRKKHSAHGGGMPSVQQYPPHATKHDSRHLAVDTTDPEAIGIGMKVVPRFLPDTTLVLDQTVHVYKPNTDKRKQTQEPIEIRFYRTPFAIEWLDALILLFSSLPTETYCLEARIDYVMLAEAKHAQEFVPNHQVMGASAGEVFAGFLLGHGIKLSASQLTVLSLQWCHIIMNAAAPAHLKNNPKNLCCAPSCFNKNMWTPEHMMLRMSEQLQYDNTPVYIRVDYACVQGTRILAWMRYHVGTENDGSFHVRYDHPFRCSHDKFSKEAVLHLDAVLDLHQKNTDFKFGA